MSLAQRMAQRGYDSDDENEDEGARRKQQDKRASCWSLFTSAFLRVRVYLQLNKQDIRARPGTYCLGVASCLIVVVVTALMLTVLGRMPILFMRLAEIEEGQRDMILWPGSQASQAQALNYSKVLSIPLFADPASDASYHAPRIDMPRGMTTFWALRACSVNGTAFNADETDPLAAMWKPNADYVATPAPGAPPGVTDGGEDACPAKRGCPEQYCEASRSFSADLYFIDFAREQRMGLGREWSSPVPGAGECVMHATVARRLGVNVGDHVILTVDVGYRLLQVFLSAELDDWLEPPYTTWGTIIMPINVIGTVDNVGGKFGNEDETFIFMSYAESLRYMARFLAPSMSARKRELFASTDPNENANYIYFNLPPGRRTEVYAQSDAANVLRDFTAFATPIIATLGFNQIAMSTPIVDYINKNRFFALFLGLILSLLILGLGFLCIVLIHSLLTVGVETRTFELGIMRMVGMTRPMLTGYVVTGALLFAIPAWMLGLIIAQLAFYLVVGALRSSLGVEVGASLTADGVGYATLVGIAMPLLSSIAPILSVLALDLPKALDVHRSRTSVITYDIQRGGAYHINWTAAGIGLAMAVAGFLVYYMFPLALLTFNITLLFYIFFGILLGMLFGLVLLTNALEGVVELGIMYAFLWWESEAVFTLIRKNLIAHRPRNRKTTLMFAMSIGFLIFLSVTADIQIQSIVYETERNLGGPLTVTGVNTGAVMPFYILDFLDRRLMKLSLSIPDLQWTWMGAELDQQSRLDNATITTVGRYASAAPRFRPVAPNFWDVAASRYLIKNSIRDSSWSLAESLYSYDGSSRAVLSTAMKKLLGLPGLDDAYTLELDRVVGNDTVTRRRLAQSEAWLDSSPGMSYSEFTIDRGANVAVSTPAFMYRAEGNVLSSEILYFEKIIIVCAERYVDAVEAALNDEIQLIGASNGVAVQNYYSTRKSLKVAIDVINLFFTFAQVMATFICYFALSSSMSTNIHEQAKEIGILRCVGFRTWPLTRTYVWEAFVLVFASSLLGIVVGVVMGYTIVLQRALFTQLPLPFVFPWMQLLVVLGLSFALGFFSSFGPIRALLRNKSVTTILRQAL
jgi:ABC-type antimicrobial peptide transport system permease subunit